MVLPCHSKIGFKIFVIVIPKEGLACYDTNDKILCEKKTEYNAIVSVI